MEENLNEGEEEREYEEIEFDTNNPLFVLCFMFMEYIKNINPELYEKAHNYAHDHTDLDITDFEIGDLEEMDEDITDDEESETDIDYEDDDNEQQDWSIG